MGNETFPGATRKVAFMSRIYLLEVLAMRKTLLISALVAVAASLSLALTMGSSAGTTAVGDPDAGLKHDHALFDTTNGIDQGAKCSSQNDFEFYASVRAINGNAVARVTFLDGDFVDYPIPNDTSFSLAQAAGGTPSVDGEIKLTKAPTSAGNLVGWVSASVHTGGAVACSTIP